MQLEKLSDYSNCEVSWWIFGEFGNLTISMLSKLANSLLEFALLSFLVLD